MTFLSGLEQDYVLGDAKVYREFDSSHFISNAKSAITKKVEAVNMNLKFDYYTNMLEKAIQSFSVIQLDKETIIEFLSKFNQLDKLDSGNLLVRDISIADVTSFKPQYLNQYNTMVQLVIDKVLKGEATENDINRYLSGEIPYKVEKQVVKTTLKCGLSPKDLIKENNEKLIPANTIFVKGKLIPFVTKYNDVKSNTMTEANAVLNSIQESEQSMKAMLSAIEKIKENGSLDFTKVQLLNRVSYNAIRGMIDVVSYVTYMMIRKINTVSSNIIACASLYNDISNLYSDGFEESVYDQNMFSTDNSVLTDAMINGDVSAFDVLSKNIYDFHTGIPGVDAIDIPVSSLGDAAHSLVDVEVSQQPYDKTIYENIAKSYMEISAGLDIMGKEGDDYLLIFDDVLKECGFDVVLSDRFKNEINAIDDLSLYQGTSNVTVDNQIDPIMYKRILSEIKSFSDNMQTISNIVKETYTKIGVLSKRFSDNMNGEYSDMETVNELKVFLSELGDQYNSLTTSVCSKFLLRLKELGNILNTIEASNDSLGVPKNTSAIETDSRLDFSESAVDYTEMAFTDIFNEFVVETENYFKQLEASYYVEKELELNGVKVILEADDTPANTTTPNDVNTQKQKDATKVSVIDNSGDAKTGLSAIKSKISEFIRNTVERFETFIKKSSTKNITWLKENKDELVARSYSNVTIKVLPYNNVKFETIKADIGKLKTNISALQPSTLKGITNKSALYAKIFSFMSKKPTEDGGKLGVQIQNYYKVGSAPLETVQISNGELKTEVSSVMIPFCEGYYTTYKDQIGQLLEDLGSACDASLSSLSTTTESVNIFEAEQQTAIKNADNLGDKKTWISEAVKQYTGAIFNALRDRNIDYLKILSSLVPKTPVSPVDTSGENNKQETTNA